MDPIRTMELFIFWFLKVSMIKGLWQWRSFNLSVCIALSSFLSSSLSPSSNMSLYKSLCQQPNSGSLSSDLHDKNYEEYNIMKL